MTLIPTNSSAQISPDQSNEETVCRIQGNDQIRKITLRHRTPEGKACDVLYTKSGGQPTTLWEASNDGGYCAPKYASFVEKQEDWGWRCDVKSLNLEDTGEGDEIIEEKLDELESTNSSDPIGFEQSNKKTVCRIQGSDQVREIDLRFRTPEGKACDVLYTKTGAQPTTLWEANNDVEFCVPKYTNFVEKQESWGWRCVMN